MGRKLEVCILKFLLTTIMSNRLCFRISRHLLNAFGRMMPQLTQNDEKICLLVLSTEYFFILTQLTPKMFKQHR